MISQSSVLFFVTKRIECVHPVPEKGHANKQRLTTRIANLRYMAMSFLLVEERVGLLLFFSDVSPDSAQFVVSVLSFRAVDVLAADQMLYLIVHRDYVVVLVECASLDFDEKRVALDVGLLDAYLQGRIEEVGNDKLPVIVVQDKGLSFAPFSHDG